LRRIIMADEVIAYTDPGCPHCRRLKEYLTSRHIPFENRDVSSDASAAAELERMNAPGVPVVRIGDDTVVGFDRERIDELLRSHGVAAGA
jgi:glutaredoxin-like YruB-family protein